MVLFLHFGWPRLWKMARRNGCRGVQFSPSNNQVCKKRSPNKVDYFIFNSIFSSETQVTVPKNTFLWKVPRWLCGQITWKIPLNELNEFIFIVKDLFILQPHQKVKVFRDSVKDFSPKFENTSGYVLPKLLLYDQKILFLFPYCWIYLLLNGYFTKKKTFLSFSVIIW